MPQVPTSNIPSVLPEPIQTPRLGAEQFGGVQAQQAQKLAAEGEKIGNALGIINYYGERSQARNEVNSFNVDLEQKQAEFMQGDKEWYLPDEKKYNNKFPRIVNQLNDYSQQTLKTLNQNANPEMAGIRNEFFKLSFDQRAKVLTRQAGEESFKAYQRSLDTSMSQALFAGASGQGEYLGQDIVTAVNGIGREKYGDEWDFDKRQASIVALTNKTATIDAKQAASVLTYAHDNGMVSDDAYNQQLAKYQKGYQNAEGKAARADSKEVYNSYVNQASRNTTPIEGLSEEDISALNLSVEDDTKMRNLKNNILIGKPMNPKEEYWRKMLAADDVGVFENTGGGQAWVVNPATGQMEDARVYTSDGKKRWMYIKHRAYNLGEEKQLDSDAIRKIITEAKQPTLFIDDTGAQITHAYNVPYAKGFMHDVGWFQKEKYPDGTVATMKYDGKEGQFLMVPTGPNKTQYQVIDVANGYKKLGTATKEQVEQNATTANKAN